MAAGIVSGVIVGVMLLLWLLSDLTDPPFTSFLANLALYDLPMSDLADYAGRVRAVTPEQVQAAFAEHLPVNRASLVIVGDGSLFLDALRAKHPNLEVIEASELNLNSGSLK